MKKETETLSAETNTNTINNSNSNSHNNSSNNLEFERSKVPAFIPIKYQYYQGPESLSISVLVKGILQDEVTVLRNFITDNLKR